MRPASVAGRGWALPVFPAARGCAYLFASLGEDVPEVFDDLGVHDHFAFVNAHLSYHVDEVATCAKHTQPAVNAPVQQCKFQEF